MKKLFVATALFIAFMSSSSFAQVSGAASAQVNLTVNAQVTVTNVRNLNFPAHVQDSTAASVNPNTGGNEAAYFILQTSANHSCSVTFATTPMTFSTGTINWTPSVVGASASNSQASAPAVTSGTNVTTNGTGYYYFWVGGTTDPITNTLPAGAYQGQFSLTVTYN